MITSEQAQELGYLLDPCFQIVNTAGKPVTNGYIEIYLHGTRTKYYAFSDWNGSLHPFQIPLDSLGSNIVLADPANSYDVYVYNAFGTLLMSRYNVKVSAAASQGGGSAPVTSETVPAMFLGEYGQRVPVLENQTGLPLPLPKGDYNTYTHNAEEIIDHYDSEGLYMYLKPGVFFVNATIRFRQNRDNVKNKVTNVKIFTGNGNWNEVNCNKLDCTGQHAEDDYNYIHCTFIRVNDSEDTDFGRFSSGILYFRPLVYDSSWEECCIQRLEIVKLNTIGGEGGQSYIPGDYVSIVGNVISVTGVLPESATGDFVKYEEFNTEIQNIHNEIDNLEITVQNATAQIVEQTTEIVTAVVEEVAPPMVTSIIEREFAGVTGDFATKDELESATGNLQDQIDNIEPGVQSDWEENDPEDPSYIQNKPDLDIYATKDELQSATSEIINVIETVTGNVPTGAVTHEELENATSVLQNEIDNIPAQVQSDWAQSATGEPDYIKNKPDIIPLVAGQNISINEVNGEIVISAEGGQPTGDYVERDELENVTSQIESEIENVTSQIPSDVVTHDELEAATANIPAQVQSDWTETNTSDPSYIQNKPNELSLVEGTNIHITKSGNEVIISADNGATGAVTQSELATATANLQTEIETVTGDVIDTVTAMIPEAQVQSNWTESDTSDPSYIQNKPSEKTLVEGENVHITASGDYIVISADGGQVTGDYVERDELEAVTADVLDQATGAIPAQVQSDWTQTVTGDPSYIKHKPDTLPLVAGDNVTINEVNGEIVISAQGGVTGDFVEKSELESATADIQTEIAAVTAQIPDVSNFIPYSATGVVLPNSHFEINANGQAYKVAGSSEVLIDDKYYFTWGALWFSSGASFDAGTYKFHLPSNALSLKVSNNLGGEIVPVVDGIATLVIDEDYVSAANDAFMAYSSADGTGNSISLDANNASLYYVSESKEEYALKSDIPSTASFATKTELATATGDIQAEIEQVTASIPSTDNLATKTELAAVTGDVAELAAEIPAITADIETVSSMITPELPVVGGTGIGITETSTEITIAVTGDYVTSAELATATAAVEADIPVVTSFATKAELSQAIGEVEAEIPSTSDLATKAEVTAAINTVTGMIPDLNDLNTAGITDIQIVNALPASPVSTVLYLVRE